MNRQVSPSTRAQRESAWRDRLARHALSGKTVKAFFRDGAVSTATFHGWRARLHASEAVAALVPAAARFIYHGNGVVLTIMRC